MNDKKLLRIKRAAFATEYAAAEAKQTADNALGAVCDVDGYPLPLYATEEQPMNTFSKVVLFVLGAEVIIAFLLILDILFILRGHC